MEFRKFNDHYIVRLDKGEEVIEQLTKLCSDEDIKLGSIVGLGASDEVEIGLYNVGEKVYHKKTLTMPMEITSLVGNISRMDNNVYLHLHINVCDEDMNVYGGHLTKCMISATCELNITKIDGEVGRIHDDEIGLNLYKF